MDTAEAITTHKAVRANLEDFAHTSRASLSMYAISGDTFCKLGGWLQDERKKGRHTDLHRLHREFHDWAGRVMRLIASRQFDAAEQMMASEFLEAETNLLAELDKLQDA